MRLRIGHKPDDWRDEGASSALIRHQASISAEPIGNMKPVLTYRANLENRTRTKPPNPFSIHREARHTPPEYPITVMTGTRTNPDNGAVKAPITEVHR